MNKEFITDSNLTHTRTRKNIRARACVFYAFITKYIQEPARNDIHVIANVTFTKYKIFISLGSIASRLVSKKNTSNI